MDNTEKQAVISIIGIIATIVIGIVAGLSYGIGAGALSAGIVLVVWMILEVGLFRKDQEPIVHLIFGIASLIATGYGVYLLADDSSYKSYKGIFSIVSILVILIIVVWIYLYLTKEQTSDGK